MFSQSCRSSTSKGEQGQDRCSYSGTRLVNSILVPSTSTDDHHWATIFSTITKKSDSYTQTLQEPFTTSETSVSGNQGNTTTVKILKASLRQSTQCKCNNYIKQWLDYSKTIRKIEVTHVFDFLNAMFEKGHAYSTINSAKCAISTIIHIAPYESLNKHPLINKYMTGIFNLRPPKSRLSFLWDVDILFRYFKQQGDNCLLSDIILTQKLIILLLLLGAQRLSTIKLFSINNMVLNDLPVTFIPTEVLKYSRKGKTLDKFEYRAYEDKTLCVIACLKEYISWHNKHEKLKTDQLIITHRKPFRGASIDTRRRRISL